MRVFYVKVLWERAGKIPKDWDGSDISPVVAQNGTASTTSLGPVSTTTLGPVSNSTNTSMSLLEQMKKYSEEDDFVELLWSITVSIFVLFGMIGSFMSGKLAERLGRYYKHDVIDLIRSLVLINLLIVFFFLPLSTLLVGLWRSVFIGGGSWTARRESQNFQRNSLNPSQFILESNAPATHYLKYQSLGVNRLVKQLLN